MQQQGGRLSVQRWRVSLLISCEHICKALRGLQAGLTGRLEVACQIELCRAAQASLCTMCGGKLARLPGPLQDVCSIPACILCEFSEHIEPSLSMLGYYGRDGHDDAKSPTDYGCCGNSMLGQC